MWLLIWFVCCVVFSLPTPSPFCSQWCLGWFSKGKLLRHHAWGSSRGVIPETSQNWSRRWSMVKDLSLCGSLRKNRMATKDILWGKFTCCLKYCYKMLVAVYNKRQLLSYQNETENYEIKCDRCYFKYSPNYWMLTKHQFWIRPNYW